MKKKIIIGSRGSKLALIYAKKVKEALLNFSENIDEQNIEIKSISTKGDTILDKRLSDLGGKGLFSKNIEEELLNKKIRDSNLPEDIRIGAIIRKDKVIIPRSNFIFEKDDLIVFLAKREELKAVENIFSLGSI